MTRPTCDLSKLIWTCGVANLLVFGFLIPISYGMAAHVPFGTTNSSEVAALQRLAEPFKFLGSGITEATRHYLAGDSFMANKAVSATIYAITLLISTLSFFLLVIVLRRNSVWVNEKVISRLFKMSVCFAVINVFVYPVFTQDFWLSVAWGRMITHGQNPYYQLLTPDALAGLPLLNFEIRMTYGPLWAIVSAVLAFLSQGRVIVEFFLFKAVLALFWIYSLVLIRKILSDSTPINRAVAICLFGWLPVSFYLSIGEGHNDVVMIFFLLLWMHWKSVSKPLFSPLVLGTSVLIKYVTLPLFIVELFDYWLRKPVPRLRYFGILLFTALIGTLVFFPFWRDFDFFKPVSDMRSWSFLTPTAALQTTWGWLHLPGSRALGLLVLTVFWSIVVVHLFRYFSNPEFTKLAALTLAILTAIVFTSVGHVWPWFIIWILAPAAVAMHSKLLRVVIPVAVLGPFLHIYWIVAPGWNYMAFAGVMFYALVAGFVLQRRLVASLVPYHRLIGDGPSSPTAAM